SAVSVAAGRLVGLEACWQRPRSAGPLTPAAANDDGGCPAMSASAWKWNVVVSFMEASSPAWKSSNRLDGQVTTIGRYTQCALVFRDRIRLRCHARSQCLCSQFSTGHETHTGPAG